MSAPRHLWSENWQEESTAAAQELARRRARASDFAEPDAPPAAPRAHPAPTRLRAGRSRRRLDRARLRAWLGALGAALIGWALAVMRGLRGILRRLRVNRRRLRGALLLALVAALAAGAAYAGVSSLTGAGTTSSTLASDTQPWLGVELARSVFGNSGLTVGGFSGGFPVATGVLVTEVIPRSPAAAAGLQPGDVLTSVNGRPVASPADVQAALAGLRAGDPVSLQYQQGALTYTTHATLVARPAGYP